MERRTDGGAVRSTDARMVVVRWLAQLIAWFEGARPRPGAKGRPAATLGQAAGPGKGCIDPEQARRIAELSHALRTPLNSVIGFSEIMRGELFGPLGNERYRDYAGHIRDDAELLLARLDELIRAAETGEARERLPEARVYLERQAA